MPIMETPPQDLVSFGSSFELQPPSGAAGQKVTLNARPGPSIQLQWGALVVADPWYLEALPAQQIIFLGKGEKATLLSTIDVSREGEAEPVTIACAAAIGPVDQVADWRPLVDDEAHFHLYPDSGLGAFFDITDVSTLRPYFADDQHMFGVYKRALGEQVVTMDKDGRVAAVVFSVPDGPAEYPVYAGFDPDGLAIAALVDLKILNPIRPWHAENWPE